MPALILLVPKGSNAVHCVGFKKEGENNTLALSTSSLNRKDTMVGDFAKILLLSYKYTNKCIQYSPSEWPNGKPLGLSQAGAGSNPALNDILGISLEILLTTKFS